MGQNKSVVDIDLTGSNTITLLRGDNGSGKSTIMSALSPFAYDGNIDNRGTVDIILDGKVGHKDIDIEHDGDTYNIHHTYKPTQTSHSVKSHITKNGIELNPNGNVTSFNEVIRNEFHIKDSDLRLFRVGTNVNSFISLSTMERKTYLSGLLRDVDIYLGICKRANIQLRNMKTLIDHCNDNLLKLNIVDYHQSKKHLKSLEHAADKLTKEISQYDIDINKIKDQTPLSVTDIVTEREHIQADIDFINDHIAMRRTTLDALKTKRRMLDERLQETTKSYYTLQSRSDANKRNIDFCNSELRQYNDTGISTLKQNIERLKKMLAQYEPYSKMTVGVSLTEYDTIMQKLYKIQSDVSQIVSYDLWVISNIIDSIDNDVEVNTIIGEHIQKTITPDMKSKLRNILTTIQEDETYTYPKTDSCGKCVYRALYDKMDLNKSVDDDIWGELGVQDIQRIYTTISELYSSIAELNVKKLPKQLRDQLDINIIKQNLRSGITIFSIVDFTNARTTISNYEMYQRLSNEYNGYVSSYDSISTLNADKIEAIKVSIHKYQMECDEINIEISKIKDIMHNISTEISETEHDIEIKTKFDSIDKDISYKEKRLGELSKAYDLYLTASNKINRIESDKRDAERELKDVKKEIEHLSFDLKSYKNYTQELAEYTEKYRNYNLIQNATTAKKEKAVPAIYMDLYLNDIMEQCNSLLAVAYGDMFRLDKFKITDTSFEIPYIKNGCYVPDVKHASQGELAIVTLTLSFALSSTLMDRYNILLIDEMDSTLDAVHKDIFLDVLKQQLFDIHAEQCFLITHSNSIDGTPVNTIDMSDNMTSLRYGTKCKILFE
jgi:DNA repair exonuclease SbcCD ATPase subunit